MKIFITGATGVLGRHIVPQLVQSGHQVRGLARSDGNVELLRRLRAEPARVDLFDLAALTQAVEACDAILHLATKIPSTMNLGKRSAWVETDLCWLLGTSVLKIRCFPRTDIPSSQHRRASTPKSATMLWCARKRMPVRSIYRPEPEDATLCKRDSQMLLKVEDTFQGFF